MNTMIKNIIKIIKFVWDKYKNKEPYVVLMVSDPAKDIGNTLSLIYHIADCRDNKVSAIRLNEHVDNSTCTPELRDESLRLISSIYTGMPENYTIIRSDIK